MELADYRTAHNKILFQHSESARQNILGILQHVPTLDRSLELGVHPNQEGIFSIYASFDRPDLYALNKTIHKHTTIFEVKHTKDGLTPPIEAE